MSMLTHYKVPPQHLALTALLHYSTTTTVQHEHSNKRLYHTPAITNKSIAYLYMRQEAQFVMVIATDYAVIGHNKTSNYCNQLKSVAITDLQIAIGYCN